MALQYDVADHVATITLDRPEVKNALNRELYDQLERAFRDAHRDPGVRCVVVTGAGSAFCSGDDVKELMLAPGAAEPATRQRQPQPPPTPAAMAVLECDKPVIAAVNGAAVGWGMDLTLFCDIRIASERARFGELFIKRGLVPDLGGLWRLPQVVGPSKAAELLFTGEIIDAAEAERSGLVSRVVAHNELLREAAELATTIAANPPIAMRFIKQGLRMSAHGDPREIGAYVMNSLAYLFTTEDHREGALIFVEKRQPVFKGK